MSKRLTACVITHGHLDIEWYQPMRSFAFWTEMALDRLVEQCRKSDDAPTYTLDGQVFPLVQYLEMHPEREEEMRSLIEKGKLKIGPFYTQFDEWIPSSEAMVRNCLYAQNESARFGPMMKVGYLPDNFGHPAQLPQLLQGFGIDNLLFMRGMPYVREDYPDQFRFVGLDGSFLDTIHFRDGYSRIYGKNIVNFAEDFIPQFRTVPHAPDYISYEHYMEMTTVDDPALHAKELIEYVKKVSLYFPSHVVPVMLGCDHSPPHEGLPQAVAMANHMQDEIEFVITQPEDYIRRAQGACEKERLYGELLGTRFQFILLGALSTRSYLKRQNFEAETLLEKYAEPLSTLSGMAGGANRKRLLDEAWRMLMLNHAHDSIHGSSVDEVHEEMVSRYNQIIQISSGVAHNALSSLAGQIDPAVNLGTRVLFYQPVHSSAARYATIWYPVEGGLRLTDKNGKELPVQPIPRPAPELNELGKPSALYYPTEKLGQWLVKLPDSSDMFSLAFAKESNPLAEKAPSAENQARVEGLCLENQFVKVAVQDALLTIEDKRNGRRYPGLNLIREQAEAGDYWDTSPTWIPSEDVLSSRYKASCRVVEKGPLRATMEISWVMNVPHHLEEGRRSMDRVDMSFTAKVSVYADVPRVDVELVFDNTACDHKVSLVMSPGIKGDILSQNAFAAFARKPVDTRWDDVCTQPATRCYPFREWLAIMDKNAGLAIAARGLYDYQVDADPVTGETICSFTLLRGVGNMSRINTRAREGIAAWSAPTYSGQCLGKQRIEFSYFPLDKGEVGKAAEQIENCLYPPMAHVVREKKSVSTLAFPRMPFDWDDQNVRFSAFKPAEDGDGYILRLYENMGQDTRLDLRLDGFKKAELSQLDESRGQALSIRDGHVDLHIPAYKIMTLRLWKG